MWTGSFLNEADNAVATRADQALNFVLPCHGLGACKFAIKTT
jgi:hypothetical protein